MSRNPHSPVEKNQKAVGPDCTSKEEV